MITYSKILKNSIPCKELGPLDLPEWEVLGENPSLKWNDLIDDINSWFVGFLYAEWVLDYGGWNSPEMGGLQSRGKCMQGSFELDWCHGVNCSPKIFPVWR